MILSRLTKIKLSDVIAYVKWNYGETEGKKVHLIRLQTGQGILKTTEEMLQLGLATRG